MPVYNYKYHVVADPPLVAGSSYKGGSAAYSAAPVGAFGPVNFGHHEKRNGHETQVTVTRDTLITGHRYYL